MKHAATTFKRAREQQHMAGSNGMGHGQSKWHTLRFTASPVEALLKLRQKQAIP